MGSNPTPSASAAGDQKRSQVQAAVRRAVGFHQWSRQPPTIERIIDRRSHHVAAGRRLPPSITRIVTVLAAGMAAAFIVIGLSAPSI